MHTYCRTLTIMVVMSCAHCGTFSLASHYCTIYWCKRDFLKQDNMSTQSEKKKATKSYRRDIRNIMSPPDKGTLFCSDSQQNMTLPCTPCVECLVIMPTVRYEAVQNRWRQQERASIKRDKKVLSKRFVPCKFLWNICHCSCDLCKLFVFHLRSENVSPVSSSCC